MSAALQQAINQTDSQQKEQSLRQILDQPAGKLSPSLSLSPVSVPDYPYVSVLGPRDEDLLKDKEQAILELGKLYRDQK